MSAHKKKVVGRKLLVASVGVAAISYVAGPACSNPAFPEVKPDAAADAAQDALLSSGNLVAPTPQDAAPEAAIPDAKDAADEDAFIGSGNLVAPVDGGSD